MEYILPNVAIFFLLVSILYGAYYQLFFKKIIYYTLHKPESEILFWLKFFLPDEYMLSHGTSFNVHYSRNKRLFSKGWLILSFLSWDFFLALQLFCLKMHKECRN